MKILHLPNEGSLTDSSRMQMNSREAFAAMHRDGFIASLSTFSFLVDYHEHLDASRTLDKIIALVKSEKPGIKIAYHEGDAYGEIFKRFDRNIKCMLSNADYVFWCGIDGFLRMAKKYGAKNSIACRITSISAGSGATGYRHKTGISAWL